MAKIKYRGKTKHRKAHPKIYVWSHTRRAEIEYFQEFKNYLKTPLLMPKRQILYTPQDLIYWVIEWKRNNICDADGDQVWCIFDVDDFFKKDKKGLLDAIKSAQENGIKIAYANECFELWVLLHFENPTGPVRRGKNIEAKIISAFKKNGLGSYKKNQQVFSVLLSFQNQAITNAKRNLSAKKESSIQWSNALADNGNPSTSIHLLVEEINEILGK